MTDIIKDTNKDTTKDTKKDNNVDVCSNCLDDLKEDINNEKQFIHIVKKRKHYGEGFDTLGTYSSFERAKIIADKNAITHMDHVFIQTLELNSTKCPKESYSKSGTLRPEMPWE